jgi:hypothetical protein
MVVAMTGAAIKRFHVSDAGNLFFVSFDVLFLIVKGPFRADPFYCPCEIRGNVGSVGR